MIAEITLNLDELQYCFESATDNTYNTGITQEKIFWEL